MTKSNKFSPEMRKRAVRMVQEYRGEYPPPWVAIESIAPKIGCVPHTLHEWVNRVEMDTGEREVYDLGEDQRTALRQERDRPVGAAQSPPRHCSASRRFTSSSANWPRFPLRHDWAVGRPLPGR